MEKLENIFTKEELETAMTLVKEIADKFLLETTNRKEVIAKDIQRLQDEDDSLQKEYTSISDYGLRNEIMNKRGALKSLLKIREAQLKNIDNELKALINGGTVVNFKDETGQEYKNVADFTNVKTDVISFNQDTILVDESPVYIPFIDEERFKYRGGILDAIRLTTDTYVVSYADYKYSTMAGQSQVFLLTLDQLVLTNIYYLTKIKAVFQKEAERKTEKSKDYYFSLPLERREKHYAQRNFYHSIPKSVQKKYTENEWNSLTLEEKEILAPAYKIYGAERFKSNLESNKMYASFHDMYNAFINPEAKRYTKDRRTEQKTYLNIGETGFGTYADPRVFNYWEKFRDMMQYKIKDISFQRDEMSDNYKTAIETSFGDSNTNDSIYADYGVLVKRQNGDKINVNEIEEIKVSLNNIFGKFGNLKDQFVQNKIKISHTGKKLVFAQKAVGCYIQTMGTIAVSEKYGEIQFNSTMAHEIAHFIDNKLGAKNGKRWETDNYESTAGIIAFTFRNFMNKPKSQQTDYINATKECFARAMQQYFVMQQYGDDVEIIYGYENFTIPEKISNQEIFVNKETFNFVIKPLIEKFLEENKDFFNSDNMFQKVDEEIKEQLSELSDIIDEEVNELNEADELNEAIETLEILFETATRKDKKEIKEAIEVLKMLLDTY
jgi:hypothetical protein